MSGTATAPSRALVSEVNLRSESVCWGELNRLILRQLLTTSSRLTRLIRSRHHLHPTAVAIMEIVGSSTSHPMSTSEEERCADQYLRQPLRHLLGTRERYETQVSPHADRSVL